MAALLALVILASCDCDYTYKYEVTNGSSAPIKVNWTYESPNGVTTDSTEIQPSETKELFVTTHGYEKCVKGPFFRDVHHDIDAFTVTRQDSLTSTREYRNNDSWEYDEEKKTGIYSTTVTDGEFQ